MRSIVTILVVLATFSAVSVHGRRRRGQQHLRSAGSTSSASVHASSRHQSRGIQSAHLDLDKLDTYSCDVSALAARKKPAVGDRLRRGEILHSAVGALGNALSKDSTMVWLRADCNLVVDRKGQTELFASGNREEHAHNCALLLTDASCSTQGDLAIIDTDTGKYLWRVQSSAFTPEVDTFLAQGDGNAVLLQEGAQLLWSTKQKKDLPSSQGYFHFNLEVREDIHSLQCDARVLQSSYQQVTGGDVLSPGQVLRAGAALRVGGANGVELRMQGDCNLVVHLGRKARFSTYTRGKGTEGKCALVITGDGCDTKGDLAIVDSASGQYIWRVPTSLMDPGADTLRLQGAGNAVLFQQGGAIAWSSGSADLVSPDFDYTFGNGRKTAALQAAIEGTAPRCDPQALAKRPAARGQALWDSGVLVMGQSLWKGGNSKASLTVKDDCNLVETAGDGYINWKSDTQGKAQKCALVITGEECDRVGDLALVDMDSGAYLWSVDTSYMRPTARMMKLYDNTLSLRQQATLSRIWRSDAGKGSHSPEGKPESSFTEAFAYWGKFQDK